MKRFLIVVMCILLIANIGCSKNSMFKPDDNVIEDVSFDLPHYKLNRENGNWYIYLNNESLNENEINDVSNSQVEGGKISFPDIDSMINAIREDSFSEKQRLVLASFREANGRIEIMNLDNFLIPIFPENYSLDHVDWLSYGYCFYLKDKCDNSIKMYSLSNIAYEEYLSKLYYNFDDNLNIISTEKIDNMEIIFASSPILKLKFVRWEYEDFKALEIFRLETEKTWIDRISDTVPANVYIFRADQGINQWISIRVSDHRYSIEELKQIRLIQNKIEK